MFCFGFNLIIIIIIETDFKWAILAKKKRITLQKKRLIFNFFTSLKTNFYLEWLIFVKKFASKFCIFLFDSELISNKTMCRNFGS